MKKILLVLLVIAGTTGMYAQQNTVQPTVSVTGEGTVTVVPDGVTITVKVENEGKDATEVKQANDKGVDATLKFIKKMKLDSKDYKTDLVSLGKNYDYQTKTYKYTASQTLTIQLKDLSRYEELMQGLLANGVNRIDNVTFTSSKIDQLKTEARKKAVANAKQKAIEYASVLDQEVGKAIRIAETGSGYTPTPMFKTNMALANESADTLAVGEMEVTAKIQVVFQLN